MINYLLTKLQRVFNCKHLTDQEYKWWVKAGRPSFVVSKHQERRVKDYPRAGTIPWDEPYERRSSPHNY